ncbi:Lrp/AsnC family transcriptional regulator [Plantactinospora soyae]|uniref:DNA-binding Lrp family transcriptional regulator n=1 Tax=Plantactinospora soyae TaxID=1544732 RepID=A0A927M7M5_9ACTN|nr:Lrp/AsnC family transcriptional regulator [Plantactinospora soyae]MBE1489474.1 DNA-binding Lrp family transcriptional regulator [Plantactinospora soyae]
MDPLTLDGLDRQLAHALQIDGRASFSQIAAVLGTSDRTIARRYRRLRSAGLLRVVGLPYAAALGHVEWLVRMRCPPDAAVPVASALAQRADTSWVTLLSGGTEITCITRTRAQSVEGELLLQKLPRTSRITAVTAHCILRAVAGTNGWPGRTAALEPDQVAALRPAPEVAAPGERISLSTADNHLLTVLAKDGRASAPALTAATGWSETTVRRRIEHLRRIDVLYFDVEIEPALFGHTAEAMLWLTVAPAALTTVTRALAGHPQVGYAAAVTGPANVAASVVCHDLDDLYQYLAHGIGTLDGVSRAETAPVVRRVKGAGTLLVP